MPTKRAPSQSMLPGQQRTLLDVEALGHGAVVAGGMRWVRVQRRCFDGVLEVSRDRPGSLQQVHVSY